jgi:hypothetical protein
MAKEAEDGLAITRLHRRSRGGRRLLTACRSNGSRPRFGPTRVAYPDDVSDAGLLPLRALVEANRDQIKAVVARHKGRAVAVFGSVARGDEKQDSDIDFLVEFEPGSSLFAP